MKQSKLFLDRDDPMRRLDFEYVKIKYGDRFWELNEIIDDYDPMSISWCDPGGCEYSGEVKSILVQIDNFYTMKEISDLVKHEFKLWFYEGFINRHNSDRVFNMIADIYLWNKKYADETRRRKRILKEIDDRLKDI
jgi:hypothetical protein